MDLNDRLRTLKKRQKDLQAELDLNTNELADIYRQIYQKRIDDEIDEYRIISREFVRTFHPTPEQLKLLFQPISHLFYLRLSQGAYARLYALHIRFVWQLVAYQPRYWSTASRLGAKLTKQISDALRGYGLYLGMNIENIFSASL